MKSLLNSRRCHRDNETDLESVVKGKKSGLDSKLNIFTSYESLNIQESSKGAVSLNPGRIPQDFRHKKGEK